MPSYKNGNYFCFIDPSDGTKIRYTQDDYMNPTFPESIDLKVTNKCLMNCPMCHENSGPNGLHGDLLNTKFLDTLHPYTELAIGGGDPLEHPDLEAFLIKMKEKNVYCNITVHQNTFIKQNEYLQELSEKGLIHGIGISIFSVDPWLLDLLKNFPNVVCHLIAGVVEVDLLADLAFNDLKVLFLGYKVFRRGENCYKTFGNAINRRIEVLRDMLPTMKEEDWFEVISFDNLALKQLEVDKLVSSEEWKSFYMGSDGTHTMFCDLVKEEFTVGSTKNTRWPLKDTIEEMFEIVKANKNCD